MNVKMNLPIAQSYSYTSKGAKLKVHAVSTGTVKVKKKFRSSKRRGYAGLIQSFISKEFTEWMPIWVWVIEHPEGNFLIDTGEIEAVNEPEYFKSSGRFEDWMNTTQFKFKVSRQEEIDQQLKQMSLTASDIDRVYLTHLHLDHVEGIRHFPESTFLVHDEEWKKPYGDLPKLYPDWFSPNLVQASTQYGPFKKACPLTEVKDFWMVHTPGHTPGHSSFILETDQCNLLFAGDISYSQDQLLKNKFASANASRKKAAESYAAVLAYANESPCIYLPSHEWACIDRLKRTETIVPIKK
jgi:glyoxylase-like metal-dependent hydrolase (beta-lactamase superfamily II)